MLKSNVIVKRETPATERPQEAEGQESLLIAALAAALVEYRQYVQQRTEPHPLTAGTTWRTIARWEQLSQAICHQKRGQA
jgi:hypothetical protein